MATVESKRCSRCKQTLPSRNFGADPRASTGLQSACRDCARADNAQRARERRERFGRDRENQRARDRYASDGGRKRNYLKQYRAKHPEKVRQWRASRYAQIKDTPAFKEACRRSAERGKERIRKWRCLNKDRRNQQTKEWRKRNPDKAKAIWAAHRHKRRKATLGGVTAAEIHGWAKRTKKVCYWCAARLTMKTYTVDHYVPISRGGAHDISNFVMACKSCNSRKNAKDPLEFAREVGRLL